MTQLLCPTSTLIPTEETLHLPRYEDGRRDDVPCRTSPSHLHILPSLPLPIIINHVRRKTQSVHCACMRAQADCQSYMNSSLPAGLMFPSSPSLRLGLRKVISSSFRSSSPRSVLLSAVIVSKWVETDRKGENFNPDFLKINPNGTVPTLVSGGQTFTDSAVCPLASSYPDDTQELMVDCGPGDPQEGSPSPSAQCSL